MVFDHFPDFALKLGLEKMSENRLEVLFGENLIFFFVFLWFYEVILALEISPEKKMVKIVKVRKINSKLLFSGKMAPENTNEIEWFFVVLPGPEFTGFYMALKMCMHTGSHWLAW